jgi:hypothetical protein
MSIQQMLMVSAREADATGGTITYSGKWQIHTFTSSGNFQFTYFNDGNLPTRIIVANGGSTGQAGGDLNESDIGGVGGNGASSGLYNETAFYTISGFGLTSRAAVVGGAASASSFFGVNGALSGGSGASGGAGGQLNGPGSSGNPGGAGVTLSPPFGSILFCGGGGGGGGGSGDNNDVGGSGGAGGTGGGGTGGTGGRQISEVPPTNGANGAINTGSGGGGGGGARADTGGPQSGGTGGLGGSGIVIVAFQYVR